MTWETFWYGSLTKKNNLDYIRIREKYGPVTFHADIIFIVFHPNTRWQKWSAQSLARHLVYDTRPKPVERARNHPQT